MAVLGPGPAVAAAAVATLVDAVVNRVSTVATMNNLAIFSVLGLVGGLAFEGIRMWFDISREDNIYSLLVLPVYILMSTLNLLLVVVAHPGIAPGSRVRVLRDSAFPSLALELLNGVLASVAVFVCILPNSARPSRWSWCSP